MYLAAHFVPNLESGGDAEIHAADEGALLLRREVSQFAGVPHGDGCGRRGAQRQAWLLGNNSHRTL
jgi:hypothetical protein